MTTKSVVCATAAATKFFDKQTTHDVRDNLMYQLAAMAQKQCRKGEHVVCIQHDGILESIPEQRELLVTIASSDNTTRECSLCFPVAMYDKDWLTSVVENRAQRALTGNADTD